MPPKLIFVYNANAGLLAGMLDSVHKIASPATYACSLCAVTHGVFSMDSKWRAYLKALPLDTAFYHRPDFRAAFMADKDLPLPLIGIDREGRIETLLSAADLAELHTVDALIAALEARLATSG